MKFTRAGGSFKSDLGTAGERDAVDQMVAVGRARALGVVKEFQDQEDRDRAREKQQKREQEIDDYLFDVLTYLPELKDAPGTRGGVEFAAGEIFELASKVTAALKPLLLHSSVNWPHAKQFADP